MAITELYVSSAGAGAHTGADEANAFTWAEMITDINAGSKAGNRYNVKADGTHANTTASTAVTAGGSSTSPVIIRGYKTTITDGYQGRAANGGALVTTNMPSVTYTTGRLNITTGTFILIESINFSGAPSNPVITLGTTGTDNAITRSVVANSSTNAAAGGIACATRDVVFDCDVSLTGASGGSSAIAAANQARIIANRIKGGPAIGITIGTNVVPVIVDNVIFACTGIGISTTATSATATIYSNTIVGGTTDGIDILTGTTGLMFIANNMITDNGGNGVDGVSAANAIFAAFNRTRDNSAAYNSATDWLAATKYGDVTTDTGGSETDYNNAGGNDYSLLAASPATSAGTLANRSIGAMQRSQTGSGSTPQFGLSGSGPNFRGRP